MPLAILSRRSREPTHGAEGDGVAVFQNVFGGRALETTKTSSFTVSDGWPKRATLVRSISCTSVRPAARVSGIYRISIPAKNTSSVTGPTGTCASRNAPTSSL